MSSKSEVEISATLDIPGFPQFRLEVGHNIMTRTCYAWVMGPRGQVQMWCLGADGTWYRYGKTAPWPELDLAVRQTLTPMKGNDHE